MNKVQVLLIAFLLVFSGCLLEPESVVSQPEINISSFVTVWEACERNYPLFTQKDVNWMDIARDYYPLAVEAETYEELILIVVDMLAELEDPYVFVQTPEGERIYPFEKEFESNVDMDVLLDNYLVPNGFVDYVEGFGWCDPAVLPYAYFDTLPSAYDTLASEAFDSFVGECVANDVPAIILDIRMNPCARGSFYRYSDYVLSRFLEYSHLGATYRYRVGAGHNMLHDLHPAIDPAGPHRYYGTVYLLTGGGCIQGAEDMAANMLYFPNTVVVGDTTGGSCTNGGIEVFSYRINGVDYNWVAVIGRYTTLTHTFRWVEGNGVPPDLPVESTEADFAAGVDPVMEYVMDLLE